MTRLVKLGLVCTACASSVPMFGCMLGRPAQLQFSPDEQFVAYLWTDVLYGYHPLPRRACAGCLTPPLYQTVYVRWGRVASAVHTQSILLFSDGPEECAGDQAEAGVLMRVSPNSKEVGVDMGADIMLIDLASGAWRHVDEAPRWLQGDRPGSVYDPVRSVVSPDGAYDASVDILGHVEARRLQP